MSLGSSPDSTHFLLQAELQSTCGCGLNIESGIGIHTQGKSQLNLD